MIDDVTRGLSLLADEADAAPIDTDAVIATATARTRNRAILATAFVTVFLVSALVLTLGAVKPDSPQVAEKPIMGLGAPALPTVLADAPTEDDLARRRTELHDQIVVAFERILPDDWTPSTFGFDCNEYHCWAEGEIRDDTGPVYLRFSVSQSFNMGSCYRHDCTKTLLADGTLVAFRDVGENDVAGVPMRYSSLNAVRPDSTTVDMTIQWSIERTAPVLPNDQWQRFATAFTLR
jgi:hypothetical protein